TLIKRCQATPGDVLKIVNGQVYINGKPSWNAPMAQTSYTVVLDGTQMAADWIKDLNITIIKPVGPDAYEMVIPVESMAIVKSFSNVKSITPYIEPAGKLDTAMFPHNANFKWNLDNFGPIKMPKRGWTVTLNDSTLALYRRAISVYEHNAVKQSGENIFINGKKATTYTFKMDYY